MKKVCALFMVLIVAFSMISVLSGCRKYSEADVRKVDGYYVYEYGLENKYYSFMGADNEKIINGVLTVPSEINGIEVTSLGVKPYSLLGDARAIRMFENDAIKKIIINHPLWIYLGVCHNLKELREVEINSKVVIDYNTFCNIPIYAISFANYDFALIFDDICDTSILRTVRIDTNVSHCTNPFIQHPENIVALFIKEYTLASGLSRVPMDSFAGYDSLSAFIVPESTTFINERAFKNTDIDVYVRLDEETFKNELDNGWDKGVNVHWGFRDELIIFDTMGGTEIKTESTQKNYLVAKIGEKISSPEQPTREGYVFLGWYKDYTLQELWDFDTDTVQESTVLIAGWQEI